MADKIYLKIGIIGFGIVIPMYFIFSMLFPFPYGPVMLALNLIVSGVFLLLGFKEKEIQYT